MTKITRLLVIAFISAIHSVIGDQYGQRLTSESLAKAGIDDRIAAILNTGRNQRTAHDLIPIKGLDYGQESILNYQSSVHDFEAKDLLDANGESPVIEVSSSEMPVAIIFKSRSPKVNVQQQHIPDTPPKVESTRSEEEPHRLFHEVYRPVIQELREVIQPYRRYVQQIQPVIEEVQQIISSGQRSQQQSSGPFAMSGSQANGIPVSLLGQQQSLSQSMSYMPSKSSPTPVLLRPYSTGMTNELSKPLAPIQSQRMKTLGQMPTPMSKALSMTTNNLKLTGTLVHQQPSPQTKAPVSGSGKPVKYDTYFLMGGALNGVALDKRVGLLRPNTETSAKTRQQMDAQYFLDYKVPIGFELSNDRQFKSKLFENNVKDNYKMIEINLAQN